MAVDNPGLNVAVILLHVCAGCPLIVPCAGGHFQWKPQFKATATKEEKAKALPASVSDADGGHRAAEGPSYLKWVKVYAADLDALTTAFGQGRSKRNLCG